MIVGKLSGKVDARYLIFTGLAFTSYSLWLMMWLVLSTVPLIFLLQAPINQLKDKLSPQTAEFEV